MGHKKRNLATRSKPSSPASASSPAAAACSDGGGGGNDAQSDKHEPQAEWQDPNYPTIKVECEKALTAFRRGNHNKALRLIRDACHKYDKSALAHRCQGTICVKLAGIIDDQNKKARHLKNGIESARIAVNLSPNSVEFSHFYANLLCETAREAKEYDEVVQECERALAIENPIDPAKESFAREQKIPTAEARIAHMQQELRSLIQKANISSLSSWMKHLGTGSVDDKFRLFPIRRSPEDPMEVRFGEPRRPNEIKKATKTPEERRKEIEVKVAAARIVQQNSESSSPLLLADEKNKMGELNNGGGFVNGHKAGERRKHGSNRKNASLPERKDQVKSYWNSMSFEKKKDLLSIEVGDMRTHYSSMKDGLAGEVLSEALSFCEVNKSWKFWICCRCGEKYPNGEVLMQHVAQEHLGSLMPKMQSVLPQCIDDDQAERLLSCSWKPLDFGASVGMFESQPKLEDGGFTIKFYNCSGDDEGKSKNCWTDSYCTMDVPDALSVEKCSVDCCNWSLFDSKENDRDVRLECLACDDKQVTKVYSLPNSWPLSDDSERAKLLEKISSMLQVLIAHKCFAINHLHKVIQFSVDELQVMAPGWPPLRGGLDQTPLCICFLGAGQLRKILKFLQDIAHACGVGRYSEKLSADDASSHCCGSGFGDKLVLTRDGSCLLLDENLLPSGGVTSETGNDAQCADSLLSWIYTGPSIGEDMGTWSRVRDEKILQATEFLQILVKEFGHLQSVCDRKFEHLSYEEALQALEDLCVDERKKREQATEFSVCSYESVLRKRREELLAEEIDVAYIRNRFEVDAIDNVLKEAENINVNQFGYEEPYVGLTSHLCDLEAGEDDDWKSKDYLQQVDTCVEVAIRTLKDQLSLELSKIDARLLWNIKTMQELEFKLESISTLDYTSIVLPLVKSFMRAHLEDLAEKDATEKSDAAREAFLAELALDSNKNVGGSRDTSKRSHEKIKDKRRNKETRKSKDAKIGSFNEHHENAGDEPYTVSTDADDGNSEPVCVITDPADGMKRMEEELFQRKIELEAEERKLEETLEYQRRMENEAKQKHLAELRKRNAQASVEHSEEQWVEVPMQLDSTFYRHKETLTPENGFLPNNLEGTDRFAAGGDATLNKSPSHDPAKNRNSCHTLEHRQGLLNGGTKEKDGMHIEQRTRRGRRRSNTKLHDGLSEKGNPIIGLTPVDAEQNGQVVNYNCVAGANGGDGGSKTLRELHAEEDDEERFQADLERAVRQSLDTFQAHHKLPLDSNSRGQNNSQQPDKFSSSGQRIIENEKQGTGLQNEVGEYNCFLNVIIQSLWHLRRFREEFLSQPISKHVHVGDPCVICALFDILNTMSQASYGAKKEAVAPTSLRVALSNLYPESNFFQEGQMNDASEVLAVIFDCLHRAFTHASSASDNESIESNCLGTWDCTNSACIAHSLFGMDIFERMNCYSCDLESRHLKYTSFFHNINASALRTMKVMCADSKFDELLNLVEMNHQLACDPEAGGCGKFNHIHHILSTPPHVFTTVLGWQNTCENVDDIKGTVAALATDIDISVLYRGLDPKNLHRLVSVVCYYGQHYHCFAYSQDSKQWIMYDDNMVKVIGAWEDVLTVCVRGHLQPQVLFYEAVH